MSAGRSTSHGTVRPAAQSDAAAIAAIYNESIAAADSTMDTVPVSAGTVGRWLIGLMERETILVFERQGRVAGWGIVKAYSERPGYGVAAETSVYLHRSDTGKGIGSGIQAALMRFALEAGYHHLVAKIWADNEPSLRLHYRFGFEMVGVQREIGFVNGRRRDVAILQRIMEDPEEQFTD